MGISSFPIVPFVEKTVLYSLNGLGVFVKIIQPYMQGFISELSNLFHWSVCLFYVSAIVVSFEIWKCETSNLVHFQIVLAIPGPLGFRMYFRLNFSISAKTVA